uniref:Uncharacterized protein n=1 Tax=Arundo donax TaxID=35708 RepID=A0A0A9ACW9_ARUDO
MIKLAMCCFLDCESILIYCTKFSFCC